MWGPRTSAAGPPPVADRCGLCEGLARGLLLLSREVSMTDPEALLQAILADPEDDAIRLVYADYLEERGEPERAEFIRVQCDLARLDYKDPRRTKLSQREAALLEKYREQWLAPLRRVLDRRPS